MTRFPANWAGLSTTLCHDWLTGMRGGERVLEILCQGFPAARIATLIHNRDAVSETINAHRVSTSCLQRVPGIMRHYRLWLPAFPAALRTLPAADGDLLISTSHCVAKSLRCRPGTRHLCYCFTPMRYAWVFQDEYLGRRTPRAWLARPLLAALRRWDVETAGRVDRFVAISRHVQERIRRFYGRDADVVYPPVDTERLTPLAHPARGGGAFDLIVSALVPYKRLDLAVRAYNRLGFPLRIVGIGGEAGRLRALAGPNVELLGWRADDEVRELYRACRLLVFPGEEDFGIVPLEAQACGKPVVAYGRGGALETVVDGVSGVFFSRQDEPGLLDALARAADTAWNPEAIRANALRFSPQVFVDALARSVEACLGFTCRSSGPGAPWAT